MMQKTQGWLTKDGTFYESEERARYHEALLDLRALHTGNLHIGDIPFNSLVAFLKMETWTIEEFCLAYNACNTSIMGPGNIKAVEEQELDEMVKGTNYNDTDQEPHPSQDEDEKSTRSKGRARNAKERVQPEMSDTPVQDTGHQ